MASSRQFERLPASRSTRHYTPKEFAAALSELIGIPVCERTIVRRCGLPTRRRAHIATNPAFPGRHYIPASELVRLSGAKEAVS